MVPGGHGADAHNGQRHVAERDALKAEVRDCGGGVVLHDGGQLLLDGTVPQTKVA